MICKQKGQTRPERQQEEQKKKQTENQKKKKKKKKTCVIVRDIKSRPAPLIFLQNTNTFSMLSSRFVRNPSGGKLILRKQTSAGNVIEAVRTLSPAQCKSSSKKSRLQDKQKSPQIVRLLNPATLDCSMYDLLKLIDHVRDQITKQKTVSKSILDLVSWLRIYNGSV